MLKKLRSKLFPARSVTVFVVNGSLRSFIFQGKFSNEEADQIVGKLSSTPNPIVIVLQEDIKLNIVRLR